MRHMGIRLTTAAIVTAGSLLSGCAQTAIPMPESPPSQSASPTTAVARPATASPQLEQEDQGEVAPHYAENNGWKQRRELTDKEQLSGDNDADRIRARLASLRASGDVSPDAVEAALLDVGIADEDIVVRPMNPSLTSHTPPPGTAFGIRMGAGSCVTGDVRPERLLVEVTGSAAEFSCLDPYTH